MSSTKNERRRSDKGFFSRKGYFGYAAEQGRWAPGGRFTLGERLFFSDTFMVRLAASELVYSGRVRGRGEIERKLTIEGGLAWLFGGR